MDGKSAADKVNKKWPKVVSFTPTARLRCAIFLHIFGGKILVTRLASLEAN